MVTKNRNIVLFGNNKAVGNGYSPKKRKAVIAIIFILLAGIYCTAVFTNIPFIKKWRDIYIETSMDTYDHKWLVFFIPQSVIDGVMVNKKAFIDRQQALESTWAPNNTSSAQDGQISADKAAGMDITAFLNRYYEIEQSSFESYIAKHPEAQNTEYDKLLINEGGNNDSGTSIFTKYGDQIVVIDAENGILIIKVHGDGYVGKMAVVRNAAQVKIGVSQSLGKMGQTVEAIAKNYQAVLAINASGFADPEWKGNGGKVVGLLISNEEVLNNPIKNGYLNIGFCTDNRLYIGLSHNQIHYRDAVEFIPAIVVNGENVTDGSMGFGIQPRTVIGQSEDGTVFMLTIDGRQVGYSLGTTVGVCADIMLRYGAIQASNLDGGSSTIMVYRDEVITKPSNGTTFGRYVPDAFIIEYAKNAGG